MEEESKQVKEESGDSKVKHVGGVNDNLGGVDPEIDENLERLSGGP